MEIIRPLLVLLAFSSLLFFTAYIFRFTLYSGRRLAMLQAFIAIGGLVWLGTELLSLFMAITFYGLVVFWGIVYIVVLLIIRKMSGSDLKHAFLTDLRDIKQYLTSLPRGLLAIFVSVLIGMLILGLIAFVAAPATWDSMTYHLSRVMHWEQNQSLAFYPTSIERQLHLSPFAEMIILNFQILAGNDHLANFVQYFAMVGCVAGVSLIAQILGGNIFAQVFASLAVMTLPMGILQSTSTQTDYVVALWLVCFVSLILKYLQTEKPSLVLPFLLGICLGLAILTKITTVLFGVSFGIWLAFGLIFRFRFLAWKQLIIVLFTALIIFAPHTIRNYKLYHSLLGPMAESDNGSYHYTNDSLGIRALASNLLRNTAIHLGFPSEGVNDNIERAVVFLHRILKMDVNDPNTTWTGIKFRVRYSFNEDLAGNPFHLILIVIVSFPLLHDRRPQQIFFALCLCAGFVLFSWILKWQPWHSRLHLPLFVLAMPLAGAVGSIYWKPWTMYLVVFILGFMSLHYFFLNPLRPLIGTNSILTKDRLRQYFSAAPENYESYQQISRWIDDLQCDNVGLMTGIDDWEYPLWVMTKSYGKDIHFEHVLVDNPSGRLETGFDPCAIVVTYPIQDQTITYRNNMFVEFSKADQLRLFILEDQ